MYMFPADSFLLLDRCFLNVMKEISHIFHNGQLSSSLSVLYQLLLHSLLSFSLDDVRKLERTHDLLFFLLTRQSFALCV